MPTGYTRKEIQDLEMLANQYRPAAHTEEVCQQIMASPKVTSVGITSLSRSAFIRLTFESGNLRDFSLNCVVARDIYISIGGLQMQNEWAYTHKPPEKIYAESELPEVDKNEFVTAVDIVSSFVTNARGEGLVFLR